MRIPDILANGVHCVPERACVIEGERVHTFSETHERANRLAGTLRDIGVRKGDRVALLANNELEYTEVQVGVNRAGATLVPLNTRLAVPEIAYILDDCTPSVLIHGPGFEDVAAQLDVPVWHLGADGVGNSYEERLAPASGEGDVAHFDSADAAQVIYTSGTTGRPKGAIISHGAMWSRLNACGLECGAGHDSVFLQALPMFHIGCHTSWSYTYLGATHIAVRTFDTRAVLAAIERNRVTHMLLVPTMINMLCRDPAVAHTDLSTLRHILYGASAIAPEVLRTALRTFRCDFAQTYGLTETFAATVLRPTDHDAERKPHLLPSAGRDSVSYQVRVVDDQDHPLPTGEAGEIVMRGPMLMDGYWNDPDATARAMRGGWFHSGDIGYFSDEGYLFVVDRLKDMVVTGGENVYPREVEDVLYEHPEIMDAAVIGVPDKKWGERVHAVVVAEPGTSPTPESIDAHCRARIAAYKVPKSFEFVDELPRNPTGKVLKRQLREEHWREHERAVG